MKPAGQRNASLLAKRKLSAWEGRGYGENFGRPHYHACLFGFDFSDKILYSENHGTRLYRSRLLEKCWPLGFSAVGDLNIESASYIARYVSKKVAFRVFPSDKMPEYVTMSRRPGIGDGWIAKWSSDVFPNDYVVLRGGMKIKPPRFYDERFSLTDSDLMVELRCRRMKEAKSSLDNTCDRLRVRRDVQEAKSKLFGGRSYEATGL